MKKSGSALILVLTLTTFLMTIMLLFWKRSSLLLDLVVSRQNYYQNLSLAKKALDLAIKIILKNIDIVLKNKELMPVFLDFSFISKGYNKIITIEVTEINGEILFNSYLYDDKKVLLCKLSCITSSADNFLKVGREDATCFMVDGFTIINFI